MQMTRMPVLLHRIPLLVVICSNAEVLARDGAMIEAPSIA